MMTPGPWGRCVARGASLCSEAPVKSGNFPGLNPDMGCLRVWKFIMNFQGMHGCGEQAFGPLKQIFQDDIW